MVPLCTIRIDLVHSVLVCAYAFCVVGLMAYGFNAYIMMWLFRRKLRLARQKDRRELEQALEALKGALNWPSVSVQLPIYNEKNVAVRLIEAVGKLDYPADCLEIQILDDSTDETRFQVRRAAERLKATGLKVCVCQRRDRSGFKAGALAQGTRVGQGEFIAIFDADFVPSPDFLRRSVPYFMLNERLACVQARWGHLNEKASWLTRAQAVGIDGHFAIEQGGRNWNGLYMNFNGTAGLWRKTSLEDVGGWQGDTLTEDLDLSYRAQLRGWQMRYLIDLVVPAEIPESQNALQRQQFRWAKGSIETTRKLWPRIWSGGQSLFVRMQALLHLTHYLIHPLMLGSVLVAPWVIYLSEGFLPRWLYVLLAAGFALSASAPSLGYVAAIRAVSPERFWKRLAILPFLTIVGVGLCLNNTRAVLEGFLGHRSAFLRTPKAGSGGTDAGTPYALPVNWSAPFEFLLACYAGWGCALYFAGGHWMVAPFLFLYFLGFLHASLRSAQEGWGRGLFRGSMVEVPESIDPVEVLE